MSYCIDPGYQIVHTNLTVTGSVGYPVSEYTVNAPSGKIPVAASANPVYNTTTGGYCPVYGSYPSGTNWVFAIYQPTSDTYHVDVYVTYVNSV